MAKKATKKTTAKPPQEAEVLDDPVQAIEDANETVQSAVNQKEVEKNLPTEEIVAEKNPQEEIQGVLTSSTDLPVKVKKLDEKATIPVRAHSDDAGIDLFALEDFTISRLQRKIVRTGVAIQVPVGHVGFIKERSGLASKKGIEVKAGVIDQYRGEILVVLTMPKGWTGTENNKSFNEKVEFKAGDKIAQMVVLPVNLGAIQEVEELDPSDRGEAGFGSTDSQKS